MLTKIKSLVAPHARLLAVMLAAVVGMGVVGASHAQFTPTAVTVESILDYSALATTMLTILSVAFAAVAGVVLALAVGKKVIAWFRGV